MFVQGHLHIYSGIEKSTSVEMILTHAKLYIVVCVRVRVLLALASGYIKVHYCILGYLQIPKI